MYIYICNYITKIISGSRSVTARILSNFVEELHNLLERDEPLLLTGSPPCNLFSRLQYISWYKLPPEVRKKRMKEALHHLHTACDAYEVQLNAGRYFLHEAPWPASSWNDERVERIASRDDVYTVRGPMCKWGMQATDRRGLQGNGYVRKETGWMTNHPGLAELLQQSALTRTHPPDPAQGNKI